MIVKLRSNCLYFKMNESDFETWTCQKAKDLSSSELVLLFKSKNNSLRYGLRLWGFGKLDWRFVNEDKNKNFHKTSQNR